MAGWNCRDFTAIHDWTPPGPPRLRVQGAVGCPTPGYRLQLEPAPPGITPWILRLELKAVPPAWPVLEIATWTPVEWHKDTDYRYTSVSIVGSVDVPVEDVT